MSEAQHLKSRAFARDRRTWIATFVLAAVAWAGTSAWLNRHVSLAPRRLATAEDDGRFLALAYDRIVPMPDGRNLDRLALREQLRGLAASGWQPVTLEELRRAYRGEGALPHKPMLLTFDEGYLATYEAADPVLRELHWPAVMFLRTDRQEDRDVSFLFWDRLRRMALSGLWEIASGDPPAANVTRTTKLPPEPPGAELIAKRLEWPAGPAWAPRGVEPLVALGRIAEAEPAASAPESIPWLGLLDDPVGANDLESSPFRVARLRVDPRWSTPELLRRANLAVAGPVAAGDGSWVPGQGVTDAGGGVVRLDARPRADIWIPAARWADDWRLDAKVRVTGGEFWIVQPGSVPGREWRVGGASGRLFIQDRLPGRPPDVLARSDAFGAQDATHVVRIVKRGAGVSASWDGRSLTSTPVAIPARWRGRVGLVAYGEGGQAASSTVLSLGLAALPYQVQVVSAAPDAVDIASWEADADEIAALSPPWASVDGTSVNESGFDRDLFRILARRYAWDIVPTVTVKGHTAPGGAAADWMTGLPARVAREGWAGVRIDLRGVSRDAAPRWQVAARELGPPLRRVHARLVVVSS